MQSATQMLCWHPAGQLLMMTPCGWDTDRCSTAYEVIFIILCVCIACGTGLMRSDCTGLARSCGQIVLVKAVASAFMPAAT